MLDLSTPYNKPIIKLYGERNTGTNYLSRLIDTNLNVKLLRGAAQTSLRRYLPEILVDAFFQMTFNSNLGWKHSLVKTPSELMKIPLIQENLYILTLTKNPYSWLLSFYRRPYHRQGNLPDFEEFLETPWKTVRRENAPESYDNPIILWNEKNRAYIKLIGELPSINIRYENFLVDPKKVLDEIMELTGCSKQVNYFTNVMESTKEDSKSYSYYKTYYLEEKWREKLSDQSINIINKYLDAEILSYFNYKII